jgi:hypothetical protein
MAMKQRKSCGNLQTKIPAKTMQKTTIGRNKPSEWKNENENKEAAINYFLFRMLNHYVF